MRRAAGLLVFACCGAWCAAEPSPFGSPARIALGSARRPQAIGAGDFDGDGRIDLVVASEGTADVTVLLGDGRGGFRVGRSFPAGAHPAEIFVGDLNHDGHPDLAIANHETSVVTILLGDGKGGFRSGPGSPLAVHSKPHPHTIDGCDINGDGNLDLVIDSWGENRLTLLLGDGRGGFQTPGTPIDVGHRPYRNLKLRDLDGDGRCDIAVPDYAGGVVTVLRNDGHGGFAPGVPIPAGPAPFTVDVADLNRDGKPDLAFSNYSGQITDPSDDAITFLLGDGKGGFRPGPRIATGPAPFQLSAGDINGDGYADVATADHGGSDLTIAFGGPDGLSPTRTVRVPLPSKPLRVLLVDVNADGRA
ncbi:MAG TPA: VCBS repeat-containing protein, partial [Thermoanaerobaculia bacterium]